MAAAPATCHRSRERNAWSVDATVATKSISVSGTRSPAKLSNMNQVMLTGGRVTTPITSAPIHTRGSRASAARLG